MTKMQRVFLEAVANDSLPKHYRTVGAIRRMANRLIREGWLSERHVGGWVKYSLTEAGRDVLAGLGSVCMSARFMLRRGCAGLSCAVRFTYEHDREGR